MLTFRLVTPAIVGSFLCAHAATLVYTDSGTFSASTPSSVFTGPGKTWAFSFQADTNPAPLSDITGGGFSLTFSSFSYFLNGSPVAITPVFVRFFSDPNGGGFGICFDNGGSASPGGRTSLPGGPNSTCTEELAAFGPAMFTGTTSAPTLIPGPFTSREFGVAVGSTGYAQPATTVDATALPEPSAALLTLSAVGLLALSGRRLYRKS